MISALLLMLSMAQADGAKITNGFLDADDHPYVCALSTRGSRGAYYAHCSCVLISERVALTAAHCSWNGGDEINDWRTTITVSPQIDAQGEWKSLHHGNLYVGPHDLAVIVLDVPMRVADPLEYRGMIRNGRPILGRLPALNQLANRGSDQFTLVGYGTTADNQDANFYATARRWTTARYASRGDNKLTLDDHPGMGCHDDSGSPAFFGDSNVVAGVLSEGDGDCQKGYYVRLDTAEAQAFVRRYAQ